MTRQQEQLILRLWRDWCKLWPEQYGHESLQVNTQGYDPVFDVIPSQAYKDFYVEVVRDHPTLKGLHVFEVMDTALNQSRAPEALVQQHRGTTHGRADPARVVGVELEPTQADFLERMVHIPWEHQDICLHQNKLNQFIVMNNMH